MGKEGLPYDLASRLERRKPLVTGKEEKEGLDSGLSVDWEAAFGDRERGERDLTVDLVSTLEGRKPLVTGKGERGT